MIVLNCPLQSFETFPRVMKVRNGFREPGRRQIHQQTLEKPEGFAGLKVQTAFTSDSV